MGAPEGRKAPPAGDGRAPLGNVASGNGDGDQFAEPGHYPFRTLAVLAEVTYSRSSSSVLARRGRTERLCWFWDRR